MIDFENREYLRIAAYWKDWAICFVMKNGLAYCVSLESKEIYIDVHPYAHFNDYGGFFEEADKIPKPELAKVEKILHTAPLPEMSEEDIKSYQYWLQLRKHG